MEEDIHSYQSGSIDAEGSLTLRGSTRIKYDITIESVRGRGLGEKFTFVDMGSCIGLISIGLIQEYPLSRGVLCNVDSSEMCETRRLVEKLHLTDSCFLLSKDVMKLEGIYDLVLCFSLVHHLLREGDFGHVIHTIVNRGGRLIVVEFPVGEDVLLQKIKSGCNESLEERYSHLRSVDTVSDGLRRYAPDFSIEGIHKVDYDTAQLDRYAFVLVRNTKEEITG